MGRGATLLSSVIARTGNSNEGDILYGEGDGLAGVGTEKKQINQNLIKNNNNNKITISGRVDRASATETVKSGSIPARIKPKTMKIGIHSFPA